jgi:hypothetical protein
MTADATFVVYQKGSFIAVPVPEDLSVAIDKAWGGYPWQDALSVALGAECAWITLGAVGVTGYEIAVWHTPDRGSVVGISNDVGLVSIVQVPEPRDWWPFQTQHLVPLVSAIGNLASAEQLGRLADAFISYARHGEGRHINRGDGSSKIDQEERDARRARMAGRTR